MFNSLPVCLTKVKDALVVDTVVAKINTFDISPLSFGQLLAFYYIDTAKVFIFVYLLMVKYLIRGLQLLLTSTEQLSGLISGLGSMYCPTE